MVNSAPALPRARALAAVAFLFAAFPFSPIWAQDQSAVANRADAELVSILTRSTLLALHHANATGNYTVLRDLSAPSFRARNTAADLAIIFSQLRSARVDIERAALLEPVADRNATIDGNFLKLSGRLESKLQPFEFILDFERIDSVWKLFGISVRGVEIGSIP